MSYAAQEMKRLMGKAVSTFNMIKDGDKILVAVSGGQDSISLLWLLRERLKRVPISYEIFSVHIDLGFGTDTSKYIAEFFIKNGFNYHIITSKFGQRAHTKENRENPCFLCSRLKRKSIFEKAAQLECNKVAFGHQKDDFIETFFLNLFFSGSIDTMQPVQELFHGRLTLIRPLFFLSDSTIKKYASEMGFPHIESGCPTAQTSKRAQIRSMLSDLYGTNRKIKGNVFRACSDIVNSHYKDLPRVNK